jgi:AraC family transcriptional regulator
LNYYVSVINKTVEYIEDSISERLTLSELSSKFDISDFHFNRMFKTVTGITLKQYILGRKLTKAMEQLKSTTQPIIDIALDLGFEYPEVFSRAFKKQFGLSPACFREGQSSLKGIQKVSIVERDIINYRGVLALKGSTILLDDLMLKGISVSANTYTSDFEQNLRSKTEGFIMDSAVDISLAQDTFYTVVSCNGEDNEEYTVFCGRKPVGVSQTMCLQERIVPHGWYVSFKYQGDMFNIREAFIDDLYRWIMVKEAELNPNGIGMLNIYENSYPQNSSVQILIPVKRPI